MIKRTVKEMKAIQKECDAKLKEIEGSFIHQVALMGDTCKITSSEVDRIVEQSRGDGFLVQSKNMDIYIYVVGGLEYITKDDVYFYAEDGWLFISSLSKEHLMKKIESLNNLLCTSLKEHVK